MTVALREKQMWQCKKCHCLLDWATRIFYSMIDSREVWPYRTAEDSSSLACLFLSKYQSNGRYMHLLYAKELKQLKTSYKFLLIPILLIESLPPFLISLAYNAAIQLKHHLNNYQVALICIWDGSIEMEIHKEELLFLINRLMKNPCRHWLLISGPLVIAGASWGTYLKFLCF